MRVLLVEDDSMIGGAMRTMLEDAGHAVHWARSAEQAGEVLQQSKFALVVLDLGLPDQDGLDLLRTTRASGNRVPVVILTGRGDVDTRVRGLDLGADDYMHKPLTAREFLARVRAVLRRQTGHASAVIGNGDVHLDTATHEARRGEASHILSAREFTVLRALLMRPGAILSRADLEQQVYGPGDEVQSNAIDFLIHGLRQKLGADAIRNVRGAGWMVERER
jgi:two-component system OmpR family response regulator